MQHLSDKELNAKIKKPNWSRFISVWNGRPHIAGANVTMITPDGKISWYEFNQLITEKGDIDGKCGLSSLDKEGESEKISFTST